jgi:hypothetical protein
VSVFEKGSKKNQDGEREESWEGRISHNAFVPAKKTLQMKENSSQGKLNLGVISTKAHELIRIVAVAGRKV